MKNQLKIFSIGQVGFLFEYKDTKWLIDPYLSDHVEFKYGENFKRQTKISTNHIDLKKINFILITHEHEDHCDFETIKKIFKLNQELIIYAPQSCNEILERITGLEIKNPSTNKDIAINNIQIRPIAVSHPTFDINGSHSRWLSYLMFIENRIFYHAGDTVPITFNDSFPKKIDLAFIPINERNVFKEKAGIIGNMTCREALLWSKQINAQQWIPTHWDMFKGNDCPKEELQIISDFIGINNYHWLEPGETLSFEL